MPEPEPEPDPQAQALANAIDLVASDGRQDDEGNYFTGWWWTNDGATSGIGHQAVLSRTYRDGTFANLFVSHDEDGNLHHNVAVFQNVPERDADPYVQAGRYIDTYEDPGELEGVTRSTRTIPPADHGLGAAWQVTELEIDYDNAGSLAILVATDAQPSDGGVNPFRDQVTHHESIVFDRAPAVPPGHDFTFAWIGDGETIGGSLDGVDGVFSCDNPAWCYIVSNPTTGNYGTYDPGLTFTPEGGTAEAVIPITVQPAPAADYLPFGGWLYVPDDVTDADGYDFGVFASGGDPFEVSNLAGVTGTATYEGDALGRYYVNGLSENPDNGIFTADVSLTADFGDNSATGFITGEVDNFSFEGDVASSLPTTVSLTSDIYDSWANGFGVQRGSTNILNGGYYGSEPYVGGFAAGRTEASVGEQFFSGGW